MPNPSVIDIDVVRSAQLFHEPYEFFCGSDFLRQEALACQNVSCRALTDLFAWTGCAG